MHKITLLFILLVAACSSGETPKPRPVDPMGPDTLCSNACNVLERFQCEEAEPSPVRRASCESVCESTLPYSATPDCVVEAKSLDALHACGVCRNRSR